MNLRAPAEVTLPSGKSSGEVTVAQISLATGRFVQIEFRAPVPNNTHAVAVATSDPSGRHLILLYGTLTADHNGWLDHGRLVPLTPAVETKAVYETW
jgi:hypothetical protein